MQLFQNSNMPLPPFASTVQAVRSTSRQLVRELGFMGGDFAGTDLPPSAVHALIEIERGGVVAKELVDRLGLEKSSVSRMLRKLVDAGDIKFQPGDDAREKILTLTPSGQNQVDKIHAFARAQVEAALGRLEPEQISTVLQGLSLYTSALAGTPQGEVSRPAVEIVRGYKNGAIARITQLHALYYAKTSGFGQAFESVVAAGLAEFCGRLNTSKNNIWLAQCGDEIAGSVVVDGEDIGGNIAHLRWFIVDDVIRGAGAGRKLLSTALNFVDEQGFGETHLWTFRGLSAARHLYETHGFTLAEERQGAQWGHEVMEQRFVRTHP